MMDLDIMPHSLLAAVAMALQVRGVQQVPHIMYINIMLLYIYMTPISSTLDLCLCCQDKCSLYSCLVQILVLERHHNKVHSKGCANCACVKKI